MNSKYCCRYSIMSELICTSLTASDIKNAQTTAWWVVVERFELLQSIII